MDKVAKGLVVVNHPGAEVVHFVVVEDIQGELAVDKDYRNLVDFAWKLRPCHANFPDLYKTVFLSPFFELATLWLDICCQLSDCRSKN